MGLETFLLQTAMALLLLVQGSATADPSLRAQALTVVQQAVQMVTDRLLLPLPDVHTIPRSTTIPPPEKVDAMIKSHLHNLRAQVELFYDDNSSYANMCNADIHGISKSLVTIDELNGNGLVDCDSTATAYAIEARLVASSPGYYCIDSTGNAKPALTSKTPTALVCP